VKAHSTIWVRVGARTLLRELSVDDRFLAYLSKVQVLDGVGTVAGKPFEDSSRIFSEDKVYKHRCHAAVDRTGYGQPVGDTMWSLSCFPAEMKTTPSNYVYC
jgi:hypothetical protein